MVETTIWPLALALRTSLATALGTTVSRVAVLIGQQAAWDFDAKGLAWVRIGRIYESDSFPTPRPPSAECGGLLAAEVEVAVIRCAAPPRTLTNGSVAMPTQGEEEAATRLVLSDMALMKAAIEEQESFALGQYTAQGPQGGMVGGSWTAYLGQ